MSVSACTMVSIPQGTIKSKQGNTPTSYYLKFQFHKVRLKAVKGSRFESGVNVVSIPQGTIKRVKI